MNSKKKLHELPLWVERVNKAISERLKLEDLK